MLMDEPFSGLDFRLRDRIGEESLALLREEGTATLLVTHDSSEAMRFADRVVLLRAGRVVQQGPPAELYARPADLGAAEFFSEINVLDGVVAGGAVATVVGPVAAPGLPDGATIKVVIRPESVIVGRGGGAATVESVRAMGPWTLAVLKPDGGGATLRARLSSQGEISVGQRVPICVESCFIFRQERPRGG